MIKKIAILGAGNGGMAMSAYLSLLGADVNLYDMFPQYTEGIIKKGGINLVGVEKNGFAEIAFITNNIEEAIKNVPLIMVVCPAFAHKLIAKKCSDYLEDGQIVVLNPGRTAGALEFLNTIRECGCNKNILIAETQSLIYSCRKLDDSTVEIKGVKDRLDIASIPSARIVEVIDALKYYYPQFVPRENVLYTSLVNMGSMFHPTPLLLNIGRIESDKKGFEHYMEGMSLTVTKFVEKLDEERVAVAKGFSAEVRSAKEWLRYSYNVSGDSLFAMIKSNTAYKGVSAPDTLDVRFVREDVPTGLVPISELGKMVGVPTPNIDSVITIISNIYGCNFRKEGRSLENLRIKSMSKEELMNFLETGER